MLSEENIVAYLPMAYDALREVLEACCVLHGCKVLSHECMGKLVKDIHPTFDLVSFERYKYTRNSINYYGKDIGLEEGKSLIKGMLAMKKEMEREVKRQMMGD
jgi:hypothetical protein